MTRTTLARASLALATLAVAVLTGSPALAADGAGVDAAKQAVTTRINLRLTALARDTTAIGAAHHLTADHKSTLQSLISADTSGLTALKNKVAGETTLAALRADATSMVNDYRIFILVGPKVRLTIVSDTETAATARLRTVHDKLADLVAKAKAAGKDTAAAEQNLADMTAALDKVGPDIDGQAAALLAVQPGPDAAAIKAKVSAVRAALAAGRADLRAAIADAKKVRDFLRSLQH
jgi:hypothetical protein